MKKLDPARPGIANGFRELSFIGSKCFIIDIPFKEAVNLRRFWLFIKPTLFLKGSRPTSTTAFGNPILENQLIVAPHYPKQFSRDLGKGMYNWPTREPGASSSYVMHFYVRGIEVLEKRSKYNKPCDIEFPDLDYLLIESALKKLGCRPPYWKNVSLLSLPDCSSHEKMQQASKMAFGLIYDDVEREAMLESMPCRGLERIHYDVYDEPFTDQNFYSNPILNGSLGIFVEFKEKTYKELKHVRSMDEQALIGN